MGVFVFELDDSTDEIIPDTRANIGVLPDTESHSRAINVFNAGHVVTDNIGVNVVESGFSFNTPAQPPHHFGYEGFTGRIEASGGPAAIYGNIGVKARMRQMNTVGLGWHPDHEELEHGDYGWGGVVLRGRYGEDYKVSGYVVAFGLDAGNAVFTVYRVEGLDVSAEGNDAFHPHSGITPGFYPSATVEVLESIQVGDFDSDFEFTEGEWYWIRAEVDGGNIRARFWEGDEQDEPSNWAINLTDNNDPLGDGFVGLVHLDTASFSATGYDPSDNSDLQWDYFEIDDGSVYSMDFGEFQPGKRIPVAWEPVGYVAREWDIKDDSSSLGGQYLQHDMVATPAEGEHGLSILSILKYIGPGKVEGGKHYRVKVVVADADDDHWDSAVFLENGSIRFVEDGQ